jgi:hypothetical protein
MAEWLKAAVLKTVSGVTRSGVRIPLPPPSKAFGHHSFTLSQKIYFILIPALAKSPANASNGS